MRMRLHSIVLALLFATAVPVATAQPVDPFEASVRHLRKAVEFQPDGLHHALLLALRDLRDPTLRPLFQALVLAEHWTIQVDAILGLAEIDAVEGGTGHVDPWLIERLRREQDRSDAARLVVELRRVGVDEIRRMLAWDGLSTVARLVLLAELNRLGSQPSREALERLIDHADPPVAGLAACLLASQDEGAALRKFQDRLRALPTLDRNGAIEELATAAAVHRLPAALDLLEEYLDDPTSEVRLSIMTAALALDPSRGARLWPKLVASPEVTQAQRVRAGLLLLAAAPNLPPTAFDALGGDDGLLDRMATAGRAVASGKDVAVALNTLYDTGHRRCRQWILRSLPDLESGSAREVALHIINGLDEPRERTIDRATDSADAVRILMEIDPEAVIEVVERSDGAKLEAVLIGLANSPSPRAGEAAGRVRRLGSGRTDSLALVVIARHATALDPRDLRQLGLIASGGGRMDPTLQAQAAWLYLRHSGRLSQALSRMLPSAPPPPTASSPGSSSASSPNRTP